MSCRPNYFSVVIAGLFCAATVETCSAQTVIHTAADLQGVSSNMAAQYVLDTDIDLGGIANFTPIGMPGGGSDADPIPFTGALDGAGHTITGLTQVSANRSAGLFGLIGSGASITNLRLRNARLTWNYAGGAAAAGNPIPGMMGILAGENDGGTIDSVTVDGTIASTSAGSACGGLVGVNVGTLSNSSASVTLTANLNDSDNGLLDQSTQIGGIAGRNNAKITNASAVGTITVQLNAAVSNRAVYGAQIGGLVGLSDSAGNVAGSNSSVSITAAFSGSSYASSADNPYTRYWNAIGGLIGNAPSTSIIANSFSTGAITVTDATKPQGGPNSDVVGGLLGSGGTVPTSNDANPDGTPTITGSSATGPIKATGESGSPYGGASLVVGGLAGSFNGIIASSYASGSINVTGEGYNGIGGLVASTGSGTITNVKSSSSVTSVNRGSGVDIGGITSGTGTGVVITNAIASGAVLSNVTYNPQYNNEDSTIGGLVGFNQGVIKNAIALGAVTATFAGSVSGPGSQYRDQIAGLVANNVGSISNSSSWGAVSLTSTVSPSNGGTTVKHAGGLVGTSGPYFGSIATLTSSFSTGAVSASGANDQLLIGGLMGYNDGSLGSSYALGMVSVNGGSGNTVGGLVGTNDVKGSITSSYWDVNGTGISVGVGSGKATGAASWNGAPITIPAGFDPATWGLAPTVANGYPCLLWQPACASQGSLPDADRIFNFAEAMWPQFFGVTSPVVLLAERKHISKTRGLNARYVFHLVQYAVIELGLFAIVLVQVIGRQAHAKCQDMIGT